MTRTERTGRDPSPDATAIPAKPRARLSSNVRRAQILAGARQVFLARGLAGARTKEIAQAAGVPEGLIYRHFDSKEVLFEAAILEPLRSLLNDLTRSIDRLVPEESSSRIAEIERVHEETFDGMLEIVPLLGIALFADGELGGTGNFYRTRVLPLVEEVYVAVESKLGRVTDVHMTARSITMALLGAYTWVSVDAMYNPDPIDRQVVVEDLARLFSRGLAGSPAARPSGRQLRSGRAG